jgi:1-acyl-sn-glycerol-3-phosphate acyltransferase
MGIRTYKLTTTVLDFLHKIFKNKISTRGAVCYDKNPVIYIANHFTRFESFVIPYVIFRQCGKTVRALASSDLFVGKFGDYLRNLGALGVRDVNRDETILSGLLKDADKWLIFPEGLMVKDKNIYLPGYQQSSILSQVHHPHTGSAVLSIKAAAISEIAKKAIKKNDGKTIIQLQKYFSFLPDEKFVVSPVLIAPLTVSYYPIRAQDNAIKQYVKKFIKKLPERIEEELSVEGSLLLGGDMNLNFREPLIVNDFIKKGMKLILNIPFLSVEQKINRLTAMYKARLTNVVMKRIYGGLQINIDHLVCSIIVFCKKSQYTLYNFHCIIYLTVCWLKEHHYHLHDTLSEQYLLGITNEENPAFNDILQTAASQNILSVDNGIIKINKKTINQDFDLHQVRLKNIISVIANEMLPFPEIIKKITSFSAMSLTQIRKKTALQAVKDDKYIYALDYTATYKKNESKKPVVGGPFYLKSGLLKSKNDIGIVLSHGYKASPGEVKGMASYLFSKGYDV